jgi:hypothetical protein
MLIVGVLVGLAAVSSVKRGGRTSSCTGGSCCLSVPGLNALGTNCWPGPVATNHAVASAVTNAEK